MSGAVGLHNLIFDPAATAESQNVGAWVRSSDGTLITHTTYNATQRLDTATGAEYDEGTAFISGERGMFVLGVSDSGNHVPLRLNNSGEIKVDVQVTSGSDKAEDAVHTSGDIGTYVLSTREDVLSTSTSATGDYQSLKTDSLGRLWTNPAANAGHTVGDYGNNTILNLVELIDVAVANRKKILVQNVSTSAANIAYLGFDNLVTAVTGIKLSAGASLELELGPSIDLYAIGTVAGVDIRFMQLA